MYKSFAASERFISRHVSGSLFQERGHTRWHGYDAVWLTIHRVHRCYFKLIYNINNHAGLKNVWRDDACRVSKSRRAHDPRRQHRRFDRPFVSSRIKRVCVCHRGITIGKPELYSDEWLWHASAATLKNDVTFWLRPAGFFFFVERIINSGNNRLCVLIACTYSFR